MATLLANEVDLIGYGCESIALFTNHCALRGSW